MKWNDFLNPRSMLTPGVAGSVVMVIANTLWLEFMVPQKWTALILSFLLIIPILIKFSASWVENVIYFTFNGLIVFALAVNTNFAGRKIQEISAGGEKDLMAQHLFMNIKTQMVSNENKQRLQTGIMLADNVTQSVTTTTTRTEVVKKNNEAGEGTNQKGKKEEKPVKKTKPQREFFQNWF